MRNSWLLSTKGCIHSSPECRSGFKISTRTLSRPTSTSTATNLQPNGRLPLRRPFHSVSPVEWGSGLGRMTSEGWRSAAARSCSMAASSTAARPFQEHLCQ